MGTPEVFLQCQGCLSEDRRCNVINEHDLKVFLRILDPNGDSKAESLFPKSLFLCWECEATLKKFKIFQLKIQQARDVLKNIYLPNLKSQCLSTLKKITKTKYDTEINTSLQFKEITILKIAADKRTILDNAFKIKHEFSSSKVKDELNLKGSPKNYDLSEDNYDVNDSDYKSDDKPIKELKTKCKILKKRPLKKNNKKNIDEDFDPLEGRPRRLKNKVLGVTRFKKSVQKKELDFIAVEKVELPSSVEENDTKKDKKPKNYEKKKYTIMQIDKDNLSQYFTKYTLSVSDYREFLERKSKTPYFINSKKKCDKCVVTFVEQNDYLEHMKLHNSNGGQFSCTLCDLHFLDKQQYHTHTTDHLTVRQCNICKYTCGLQHSISVHLETVHRGLLYLCRVCGVIFEPLSAMLKHYNLLHKRLVCNECGKFQYKKNAMSRHMRSKHFPPKCPHCDYQSKGPHYLLSHLVRKHNYTTQRKCEENYKMEDMYCVECDKQFTTMEKFKSHTREVHRAVKRRYPCPVCEKVLTKKTALNNHYNLFHGAGTKHRCEPCNKCYVTGFALRSHIKHFHQKIPIPKTKVCDTCGRSFQSNDILKKHMRTHTGERPYECSHCDARFTQKCACDAHVRKQHANDSQTMNKEIHGIAIIP